jgi:hypothetical protein
LPIARVLGRDVDRRRRPVCAEPVCASDHPAVERPRRRKQIFDEIRRQKVQLSGDLLKLIRDAVDACDTNGFAPLFR